MGVNVKIKAYSTDQDAVLTSSASETEIKCCPIAEQIAEQLTNLYGDAKWIGIVDAYGGRYPAIYLVFFVPTPEDNVWGRAILAPHQIKTILEISEYLLELDKVEPKFLWEEFGSNMLASTELNKAGQDIVDRITTILQQAP